MKELTVSLDICAQALTLAELSKRLNRTPSAGSHDRGDHRPSPDPSKAMWTETIWRLDSKQAKCASFEEHLQSLVAQLAPKELLRPGVLDDGCTVWISVGLFFDTANASLSISSKEMDIVRAYGATLEVACYPCQVEAA